jgi:glycosyltransferase involved in cell wall biosynthesis
VVGCVGTFKAGKGQATLVTVMAAIRERIPGAWLVFVGEGPLLAETQALVASLGLDRVRFLGTVHDPTALYPGFDAFVSASESEGLPNVVLEAAAAARPIVATDAGGTREIVTDGSTGLLVPVGDASALGEGLVTILHDRDLAKRLGLAAREVAARDFAVDRLVTQTAALYEELTARARHAG